MWLVKIILGLACAYAAIVLVIYAAQTLLLFPAGAVAGSLNLPHEAERIAIDTADGERLHGLRIAPSAKPLNDPTIVLGFAGNAWNADDAAAYLHQLFPEAEVVTFHYRGYRPSTGRPSAAALLSDAPLIYDHVTASRNQAQLVAVGFSIGSGVAAHLAKMRPVDGLILVTPFDTLERVARQHYWWLPAGLLLRHHMSPVDALQVFDGPVALIAAERDAIIPSERIAALRDTSRNLVLDRAIPGAGHNDLYDNPQFVQTMHEAMTLISTQVQQGETRASSNTPDR